MISNILIIRLLPNMVNAVSTMGLQIAAFGVEDGIANPHELFLSGRLSNNVKFCPMNFPRRHRLSYAYRYISILGKIIRNEKPDVVHVNALQDLFLTYIVVLLLSSQKRRPAIIAMSHNPVVWKDPRKAWFAAQAIKFFADGFICLATFHKKQLVSFGVPAHKLTVIPNPYEIEEARLVNTQLSNVNVKKRKDYQIIYVANVCRRKAQDVLLRAAAQVLEKYPNTSFHFIGKVIEGEEDYAENLYSLQKELRISERTHFSGALAYTDVLDMVQRSDAFVFPSYAEMMPRAVIEAMLLGKPIVATSVDGIPDLISHGKTGILVEPGSVEELTSAICKLIENPSFAKLLGSNAQKDVTEICSPERVGKSFVDFYQGIIDNKPFSLR